MADLDNQVAGDPSSAQGYGGRGRGQDTGKGNTELGMVRPGSPQVGNNGVEVAEAGLNANVPATTETEGTNPPVDVKLEPTVPPEEVGVGSGEKEVRSKEEGARGQKEEVGSKEQGEGGDGQIPGGEGQATNGVVPPETMKDMVAKISSAEGASVAGAMGVEEEIRAQREAGGKQS